MKIEAQTVLEYLKPKVKAFGFKKEIVEGIASDIAETLDEVDDEATEEDIDAVVQPKVDAMIPSLKLAQRLTNQGIEEFRKKQERKADTKPVSQTDTPPADNTPDWAKALLESNKQQMEQQGRLIETLQAEIMGMKTRSTADKRRSTLEKLLKGTGTFGTRTMKRFERMTFETEEDFDDCVTDIKQDLRQLNQERADIGLKSLGSPEVQRRNEPPKPKVMSEAEIEEMANYM